MSKDKDEKPISMRGAAVIQFASKYANVFIQLAITAVLSRLIDPADFGEVAIVTVFTSFFALFSDMGIAAAVVQFRELETEDFEKLFTFSLFLGLGLAALFGALSPVIAWFYADDALVPLLLAVTPAILFSTLNMVPGGLMLREKRFKQVGVRLLVSTALAGAAATVAAFAGWGAYALILQSIASSGIVVAWNLVFSPIRHLDVHFMGPLRKIFSYSSFQFGFNFVNYFSRNLDNLLIGKVFGNAPLGYYNKAYGLTTCPNSYFTGVINTLVQPFMAEHQKEPDVIWDFWFKLIKVVSVVAAGTCAVLVVCAYEVIMILYGSQWAAAVPLFQVLALSIYTQMLGSTSGGFFQSLGRTDLMFKCGIVNTGMMVVLLVIGLLTGDLQVTTDCVALAYLFNIIANFVFLIKGAFHKSLRVTVRLAPEIVTALIAIAVGFFAASFVSGFWLVLVVKVVVVCGVLLAGYTLTHQWKYIKLLLKG